MISSLHMKNFLSFEKLDFSVLSGISMIRGKNLDAGTDIGAGKTSIPNGICWVLYGKLARDNCLADAVIRNGAKSCSGELLLASGHKIVRTRKPNDLAIVHPDSSVLRGKDIKDTQKLIDELVGMSFETFRQCVYFAQNDNNRFLNASETDKVKILSEIKNLGQFDKASKRAADKAKTFGENYASTHNNMEKLVTELSHLEKTKNDYVVFKEKQISSYKEKQDHYQREIDKLSTEYKRLSDNNPTQRLLDIQKEKDEIKSDLEALREELTKVKIAESEAKSKTTYVSSKKSLYRSLELEILSIEKSIGSLTHDEKNCGACGSVLDKESKDKFHKHILNLRMDLDRKCKDLEALKGEITALEYQIVKVNAIEVETAINNAKVTLESIEKEERTLASIQPSMVALEREIGRLSASFKALKTDTEEIDKAISQVYEKIAKIVITVNGLEVVKNDLKVKYDIYDGLKEHFKEVKKYAFQSTLDELNQKANRYLAELYGVPASINLTNTSEDGDISKIQAEVFLDGQEVVLSGGQERLVGFAIDLSLSDIISGRADKAVNITIWDEYFKDLDLSSMMKVQKLLSSRRGSVLLIEHSDSFKEMIDNHIQVIYEKKISRIEGSHILDALVEEAQVLGLGY